MSCKLNDGQLDAVNTTEGPLLILAGAGSGKTRVVTTRIINLIDCGVSPNKILGLTFTNKAASEMKKRVVSETNAQVLICTFHALGANILRESIHHLGFKNSFTIYDDEDSKKLLKNILGSLQITYKKSDLKTIKNYISQSKSNLDQTDTFTITRGSASIEDALPEILREYQQSLQKCHAVDFDDLLYLPILLFQQFSDVLAIYQDRFSHILIDEYQDTNQAQYELIKMLSSKHNNICVVGDPDQSIYSWRGANIANILNFEKDFSGAKVIRLEQNYRSTSNILEAANALVSCNYNRYEKNLWSDLGAGEKIKCQTVANEQEEAMIIAEKIAEYHEKEQIPLSEMVVLYRTNSQAREFEDRLISKNLPYVIVGGISFYQRREIKDILAFLRLIHSESDFISFERVINIPPRGFGKTTIEKIRAASFGDNIAALSLCKEILNNSYPLKLSARQKNNLQSFISLIQDFKSQTISLSELIIEIINQTGYLKHLSEDRETFDDRRENLDALITKAKEWQEANPDLGLSEFLEELSLKANIDDANFANDKVNLMTLHNSKGLEFTSVFLAGMEEDLFPHINSKGDMSAVEEERRLCYVGMTRAKKHLHLTNARFRYLWGVKRRQRASRFLKEIPPQYKEESKQENSESCIISIGDAVMHDDFGVGVIKDKSWGSYGLTYKILFSSDLELKSLVAKYANLTKL